MSSVIEYRGDQSDGKADGMPADAETVTAIHEATQALANRIEAKIDRVAEKGEEQTRRVHDRFDRHEKAEGQVFREFTASLQGLQTEIKQHSKLIERAEDDRKGLWKWIIGVSTGAGAGSGFLAKLFGSSGP